jgi:hypothetical protein
MEIPGIDPEVDKEAFPHPPFPAASPQFSPMAAYLSRLAPSSRLTMAKMLRRSVELPGFSMLAGTVPSSRPNGQQPIETSQLKPAVYEPFTARLN